jgi:hypothetical protein
LGVRYQNYTGKAIFMPLSIGAGIDTYDKNNTSETIDTLHVIFVSENRNSIVIVASIFGYTAVGTLRIIRIKDL